MPSPSPQQSEVRPDSPSKDSPVIKKSVDLKVKENTQKLL